MRSTTSIWTDHTAVDYPQFQNTDFNPNGYPFFTGKVAMSTNYLWSLYGVAGRRRRLEHGGHAVLPGPDRRPRSTPTRSGILKSTKNPDAAFTVLTYLLDNQELLKLYGGMPAVESEQDAFLQSLQADYTQTIDWNVAKDGVNYADVPNFESYTPAYNETLDLVLEVRDEVAVDPGLDLDAEIADLKTQMQAIWDKGGLIR